MADTQLTTEYRVKERIRFGEIFGYGLGDLANNLVYGLVSGFATYYYTNSAGMAAGAVGTMFMISRIFDGISDIIMGLIIDRTKTKYGKARPWILWMAIPFAIAVVLQFTVPQSFSMTGKLIYAYITYNLLSTIIYTASNQAYGTLNVLITDNPQDRAKLSISRMALAMIGVIVMNATIMPLIRIFGGGSRAWTIVAAMMGVISIVLFLITFWSTKERLGHDESTEEAAPKKEKTNNKEAVKALFHNKYWVNRILFALVITVATMTSSANVYYAQYWLNNPDLTGMISIVNVLPMLVALAFVNPLLKKIGNRNTSLVGAIIMVAGFAVQLLAPANLVMVLIGTGVRGFGTGLASTLTAVMLGDTIDYGEWKSGIRTDGLVYSASTFGTKVGNGLATASLGWALAIGSFDASLAVQAAPALNSIKFVFTVLPMIASILAVVLNLIYDLDKKMPQILHDLKERNAE